MDLFSPHFFVVTLALVGLVIIIAALLSGLIDRSDLPQVGVFLALGAILGPAGLGLLNVTLESPIVAVVATLSLVLVLFTDAVSLSIAEIQRHGRLAFLVLGPGTLLTAALVALVGWSLLGLPPAAAAQQGQRGQPAGGARTLRRAAGPSGRRSVGGGPVRSPRLSRPRQTC